MVGIGPRVQEVEQRRPVALRCGQHQWRAPVVVAAVQVHTAQAQQPNGLRVPLAGCVAQIRGRETCGQHHALVPQVVHHGIAILLHGVLKRLAPPAVAHVRIGTRKDQRSHHLLVALGTCEMHGGALVVVAHVRVHAVLQHHLHRGQLPVSRGRAKCSSALALWGLHVRALQHLDHCVMLGAHGIFKWSAAPAVLQVGIGPF
mmetsp:Transcript_4806/g.8279  ORF Transcript_4806/g.8279 Transcript_4806/m.8279 type:complete len:202 (-) Transcript_4806:2272-2877(-)